MRISRSDFLEQNQRPVQETEPNRQIAHTPFLVKKEAEDFDKRTSRLTEIHAGAQTFQDIQAVKKHVDNLDAMYTGYTNFEDPLSSMAEELLIELEGQ